MRKTLKSTSSLLTLITSLFDAQALDMFITGIDLTVLKDTLDNPVWTKVASYFKHSDLVERLSFLSRIRFISFLKIVEKEWS